MQNLRIKVRKQELIFSKNVVQETIVSGTHLKEQEIVKINGIIFELNVNGTSYWKVLILFDDVVENHKFLIVKVLNELKQDGKELLIDKLVSILCK